jgi:hypothetical protein
MNAVLVAQAMLAAVDPEQVKPGWVALVIVVLMGVATFLLWRSMNHQLRKVTFDEGGTTEDTDRDD